MPPLRTMQPAKPVKTERTHEENQERAYIAASRRSDRSLEARVESARRASEIHKKRTGRSLRVTEQDVINEEMYEEEDDDLPHPYRRLNSHLMTNDSYLDRRLHSYLVNQVAMRTMVGQAVQKAWNENSMYPHAMQAGLVPPGFQNPMGPPQSRPSGQYRQTPYPVAHNLHHRPTPGGSPAEMSFSNHGSPITDQSPFGRRVSYPAQATTPPTPTSQQSNSPVMTSHSSSSASGQPRRSSKERAVRPTAVPEYQPQPYMTGPSYHNDASFMNPLTATLPMDAQQLLAGADWNDPMMHMFMPPQSSVPSPMYSYKPNGKPKGSSPKAGKGLNQTLAPAMSDATTHASDIQPPVVPDSLYAGFDMSFDDNTFGNFDLFKSQPNSSGQLTPGEGDFDSFINDGVWGEQSLA